MHSPDTQPSAASQRLQLLAITDVDVAALDPETAISFAQMCEHVIAWATSRQNEALVVAAGAVPQDLRYLADGEAHTITDVMREEIALALRWSSSYTQQRIDTARALHLTLPSTRHALESGQISQSHATIIANAADRLTMSMDAQGAVVDIAALHGALEHRVLPTAFGQNLARTRQSANRAVERLDADGAEVRRAAAALHETGVWLYPASDGLATLLARLPIEQAVASMHAIENVIADKRAPLACDLDAPIGARRAAALAFLVTRVAADAKVHATVDVVVDLETLLGLKDRGAEIGSIGSVPGDVVRNLILDDPDATVRRVITDPGTGHLLELGADRYAVSKRLREFLVTRDQRCRFPGCYRKASKCEIDHALPWDEGGRSTPDNLGALCKRHHQLKTHANWQISESDTSGACKWTSPGGREYRHPPVSVLEPA